MKRFDNDCDCTMRPTDDGEWVRYDDAWHAIYEAVNAERQRTFDMLKDDRFVTNVCLSYRHDYGLLSPNDRFLLRLQFNEWARAIVNNYGNFREVILPNVNPQP